MCLDAAEALDEAIERAVAAALDEDLDDDGDVTSLTLIDLGTHGRARLVAREALVVAGLPIAERVFRNIDPAVSFEARATDGDAVDGGTTIAEVSGEGRGLLIGERTALNFLMRLSGVASLTRRAVDEIAGTGARILDTRKTIPGLRRLDKYAVAVGGGVNHRMGLFDAAMIKDTHLALQPAIEPAVARLLERGLTPEQITVEVRSVEQLEAAIASGAGRALLDNMDLDGLRACVAVGKGKIVLEASGGLAPGKLRPVAETGVDFLSLGALTHSAMAADVAMEMELES